MSAPQQPAISNSHSLNMSSATFSSVATTSPITVAVDPVALVVTECVTVTSAMRKHPRWAQSSISAILGGPASTAIPPSSRLDVPGRPRTAGGSLESGRQQMLGKRKASQDPTTNARPSEDKGLTSRLLRGRRGQGHTVQENPLLNAFATLRGVLKNCTDIRTIDASAILHPFTLVIRSSSTPAHITSFALFAITKFLAYRIISPDSPGIAVAMQLLATAVTHCRFEALGSSQNEIVLFRVLTLMETMITGLCGELLSNGSMFDLVKTGLEMCSETTFSELLRRTAEVIMTKMCQTIFHRLKGLDVEVEDRDASPERRRRGSSKNETVENDIASSEPIVVNKPVESSSAHDDNGVILEGDTMAESTGIATSMTLNSDSQLDLLLQPTKSEEQIDVLPYGVPAIRELFKALVGLLDPEDRVRTDGAKIMALRIVDVTLEVAGPSIANHPSLAILAKDTLCRHLFQLVRSDNMNVLNASLRVAGTLLSTCREVLKLQQELFLSYLVACLHPRIEVPQEPGLDPAIYDGVPSTPRLSKPAPSQAGSGRSTPVPVKDRQKLGMEGSLRKPDALEVMLESVGTLVRIPSFMAELFVNYDCDIDSADLCLDMVGLLSRSAFPDAASWSTATVPPLCLDALLGFVQSMHERMNTEPVTEVFSTLEQLREQRELKKSIIKGATKFNEKPKAGLAYLASQGIIENVDDPEAVAKFLRGTSRIDKKELGEYLSKRGNEALLSAFLDTFDFSDIRLDEALRQMFNSFRLPGEAQLIERIVVQFAQKYLATPNCDDIADTDSAYVLTYAVIMLNTDQHNPNVRGQNRMAPTDFARNLRGTNGGKDFEFDYLQEIYDSIKTNEFVLAEEHNDKRSFDHAWKNLQIKIKSAGDLQNSDTNLFDADMFAATWRPIVATLSYVFFSATDETVFSRVNSGFVQCAELAAKYNLHETLDHILFCLSSMSTLATATLPSTSLNTEVQAGEKSIMVSETAVRFGRNERAQLALATLFQVIEGNEAAIREGWSYIIRILLNLFVNSLLNPAYSSISSQSGLPSIPLHSPAQVVDRVERAQEGGLFSAFTSYVSSFASDEPPEPSDKEIEDTLYTVDSIAACNLDKLFATISQLPPASLKSFLQKLLAHLPEESTPRVISVKSEMPAPTPIRPNGQKAKPTGITYDPSVVFVLELATMLVARDRETMDDLGKVIAEALQGMVRDAEHVHPVTLSRAVYYLLSFLRSSCDHDFIRVPIVLHTISKLSPELISQSSTSVVRGLTLCLNGPSSLRNEMVNSPDFWSVLKALQAVPEMSDDVFTLFESVAVGEAAALTTDNYEFVIAMLGHYATAGSIGAQEEQRRDIALRRGKGAPPKKGPPNPVVTRGLRAVQMVGEVTGRVPHFIKQSHLEAQEAWTAYWNPPFRTLATQSLNPCRVIRTQSLSTLQRVLLSTTLETSLPQPAISTSNGSTSPSATLTRTIALFTDALFPLLTQLLKPEIWHSDPGGMGETRLQAAVMCCKVFVRHLDVLLDPTSFPPGAYEKSSAGTADPLATPSRDSVSRESVLGSPSSPTPASNAKDKENQKEKEIKWDGIRLWSRILQMMERLLKSSPGSNNNNAGNNGSAQQHGYEGLDEAIPESLKNIVLVMASAGYLVPPSGSATPGESASGGAGSGRTPLQRRLWEATWARMERFLPGLLEGAFPGVDDARPTPMVEIGREEIEGGMRELNVQSVEGGGGGDGEKERRSVEEKENGAGYKGEEGGIVV